MKVVSQETLDIVYPFLVDDITNEYPKILLKNRNIKRGSLIKRIEIFINELSRLDLEIEVEAYHSAVKELRGLSDLNDYEGFINELCSLYV